MKEFNPIDYGAYADGKHHDTEAVQKAIDAAAAISAAGDAVDNSATDSADAAAAISVGDISVSAAQLQGRGRVVLKAGKYLVSSLFLRSNIEFCLEEGAVLLGTTDEDKYPVKDTRVAGIEMPWFVGVLNVENCQNVKITGKGTVDGQGERWWEKYWGKDRRGGMSKEYRDKNLRWCVDYDCRRPRNIVVMSSENVEISGISSVRSGFWNVHVCYSSNVHIDGISVSDNAGPSTDGIDIDSCNGVTVENCRISCNDDNICIKAGRDADGLRVNRKCENVLIQNCEILRGAGVTIGSETSGGMNNITIRDIKFKGTDCGFRIKSAKNRGGVIENITVDGLDMINVRHVFEMGLNWNPSYSYSRLPDDYVGEIPKHWLKLLEEVPEKKGIPEAKDMHISNVCADYTEDYTGRCSAFEVFAFPEKPIKNVTFENINIHAKSFGNLNGIKDWKYNGMKLEIDSDV